MKRSIYRDAAGRFRRRSYDELSMLEKLAHDSMKAFAPGIVRELLNSVSVLSDMPHRIGPAVHVRLPGDY